MGDRETNRLYDGVAGSNGSIAKAPVNKCWGNIGSVDVEDLALLFGDNRDNNINFNNRTNTNRNHRVFRNRTVPNIPTSSAPYVQAQFNNIHCEQRYYGCDLDNRCYKECTLNIYQQQQFGEKENYGWNYNSVNERINDNRVEDELPLALGLPCTEDEWLACPATNCPIFDNPSTPIANTDWSMSANKNPWNFYENQTTFGPVLPACMINGTLDRQHRDIIYRNCYTQWEEEQRYFEDYLTNEKRKEKSRDAARCRRSRETDIFTELSSALPLTSDQTAHLDKASVMRLAIAYLKVRSVIDYLAEPLLKTESSMEMDALFPKALDGFMLVLSSNGDMVYLSENVTDYLGVSQMDLMGQSVYEYSHPCDHDELRKCLSMKPIDVKEKRQCNFFLRLKCTLTSKGRKVNLKSASYKVIHFMGRAMGSFETKTERIADASENGRDSESSESSSKEENEMEIDCPSAFGYNGASLVLVGCPIPHPSNIEVPLGRLTFLSKHNLNMKFTYADDRLAEHLGWTSSELLGKSVFEFHHALDNLALEKSFKSLFSKGQCETTAYRFLGRKGGYAWVVTQATLIHCSKQHKPLSVVCVNHILSGIESEDEVYSERQLEARKTGSLNDHCSASITEDFETEDTLNLTTPPALVLETPSATNTDDSFDEATEASEENDRDDRKNQEKRNIGQSAEYENDLTIVESKTRKAERVRPLAVTASIFRSQSGLQDSRKDLLPGASQLATKVGKAPEPRRSAWYFQDKPILEYEPPRNRPQAVTRNLFVPLIQDQDIQQTQQQEQLATCRPPPQTATASIFAPRTEDMNKGFLTFSEDQPGLTMLKDEPEDLTHLAPTPGDVCVPLEDTPFLSDISLDEFILGNENYCPLLSPEGLPSELPSSSDLNESLAKETPDIGESLESSLADGDPFIYRDIPSPCSLSSDLLSPAAVALGKSPDPNSIESLQSPKHNDIVDGMINIGGGPNVGNPITEDEMLMLSINDVIGDDELALRAPYIPMSDQDEALQLLISDDTVMWGPTQPPDKKTKWHHDDEEKTISKRYEDSSLARLLKNENRTTKCNDHGGGLVDPAQIFGQIGRGNNNSARLERPSKRVHAPLSSPVPNDSKRSRFQEDRLAQGVTTGASVSPSLSSVSPNSGKQLNSPNYDEQCIDLCGILAPEEKLEPAAAVQIQRGGSRLLLQQLMSRDNFQNSSLTKARDASSTRSFRNECSDLPNSVEAEIAVSASDRDKPSNASPSGDGGGMEPTDPGTRGRRQSNSVLMNLLVSGCDKTTGQTIPLNLLEKWSPMSVDERSDSQLVPTNNRTVHSFFDEYSAVPAITTAGAEVRSNDFVDYFDNEIADMHLRSNLPDLARARVSAQRRYVK